ncbi:efflux RND transporter periplasmic adaptor subunit [Limobrevibacterium gyesilva]|uniref:Efflux RND transporter periplasmic adaptor subunit n=1 Tax=Limobrevibacterium gyesilva TaxID=2991712 RepID=A0AA42CHN7_9PROT|nr:efflux RND transporter periplasmic adaptor subunit [Limobrevibacterium gyesilva]MCW3475070.1 efflux RND transporter periplasmic adaptor subunit [Limobrevibacterium gyesilva]
MASFGTVRRVVLPVVVLAALAGVGVLAVERARSVPSPGTMFGNVEIRQVDLAFQAAGAVQAMARREGDAVRSGELVAELDDATYQQAYALAEARRDAAKAQLDLLLAGTRPEQIDQARANVANAQATLAHAEATFARQEDLVRRDVASRQAYDDARMALDAGRAALAQYKAALAEAVAGPRPQEIEAARAQLRSADSTAKLAAVQLSHTRLTAPTDGVVMTRVIEPGTVVLPGSAVYSIAIAGEVWVRAFAPEPLLGRVAPGTEVRVSSDGGHAWRGRVGYVSPVAEFTPKTVETPELRTQLVYRLRIRIENPDDALRQGMPVTIQLPGG